MSALTIVFCLVLRLFRRNCTIDECFANKIQRLLLFKGRLGKLTKHWPHKTLAKLLCWRQVYNMCVCISKCLYFWCVNWLWSLLNTPVWSYHHPSLHLPRNRHVFPSRLKPWQTQSFLAILPKGHGKGWKHKHCCSYHMGIKRPPEFKSNQVSSWTTSTNKRGSCSESSYELVPGCQLLVPPAEVLTPPPAWATLTTKLCPGQSHFIWSEGGESTCNEMQLKYWMPLFLKEIHSMSPFWIHSRNWIIRSACLCVLLVSASWGSSAGCVANVLLEALMQNNHRWYLDATAILLAVGY